MEINNLSFITPIEKITNNTIVLKKTYTQKYQLLNGSELFISSHIGNRTVQQDCVAMSTNGDYLLLIVSDGIGGMKKGEMASYKTAEIIQKWFDSEDEEILKSLNKKNFEDVLNALMYLISTTIPNLSGATLNMSIICPDKTLIANIGDSRTYTKKDGKLTLRTEDDSLVFKKLHHQSEKERNKLRFHKQNHILTNSITTNIIPTINVTSINNEDYEVLCHVTDGVTDFLSEYLIKKYVDRLNPANLLVAKATKGFPIYNHTKREWLRKIIFPGQDNATAIVYTKKRTKNN